jgi:Putative transmembrane protein (PGPGW)
MIDKLRGFFQRLLGALPHPWRWLATVVIGFSIVIIGIILLPLPGPGMLIILLGVAILAAP